MRPGGTEKELSTYQLIKSSLIVESPSLRVSSPSGELMGGSMENCGFRITTTTVVDCYTVSSKLSPFLDSSWEEQDT